MILVVKLGNHWATEGHLTELHVEPCDKKAQEFDQFPIYNIYLSIYLFGVLRRFQHCTGHITMGSWNSRVNQYMVQGSVL